MLPPKVAIDPNDAVKIHAILYPRRRESPELQQLVDRLDIAIQATARLHPGSCDPFGEGSYGD